MSDTKIRLLKFLKNNPQIAVLEEKSKNAIFGDSLESEISENNLPKLSSSIE